MKRTVSAFIVSVLASVGLLSCSNYNSSNNRQRRSGLAFRVFVSNPLDVTSSGVIPALVIVDASKDVVSLSGVSLLGVLPDAGMMALSPKKDRTLVVSPTSNRIAVVDNATETASSVVTLPGSTESLFVWTDNTTAFVAVPSAPVPGQAAGGVDRIDIPNGAITATIPVPGAHYVVPSPSGNQILVFSDNSDEVTLLLPSLIGTGPQTSAQIPCSSVQTAACTVSGFDRPVWGAFSADGSRAYVMNCGPECGGTAAGVTVLDMTTTPPALATLPVTNPIPVSAATIGILSGNNLYVAGTPQPTGGSCAPTTTLATNCGQLTVINTSSMTVTNPGPLPIADGHHDHMEMGANGQLFIGSRTCSNVNSTSEVRGCLSIVNTASPVSTWCSSTNCPSIIMPPANGDVTGIEPIPNRSVVYVCQGGALKIYDTATDQTQTTQINIVGQVIDVKVVDF